MKRCPTCERTYPDAENFCEADRSALISDDPAFVNRGSATPAECPVCGGKTQPGELICNFCGARLTSDAPASGPLPTSKSAPTEVRSAPLAQGSDRLTGRMVQPDDQGGGRSAATIAGYVVAAVVALSAGAWLAIKMSASKQPPEAAASASASPEAAASAAAGAESAAATPNALPSAAEANASPSAAPSAEMSPPVAGMSPAGAPSEGAAGAGAGAAAAGAAAAGAGAGAIAGAEGAPTPKPVVHHRAKPRPVPTPSLQQMVKEAMRANPKLRRVDCYTSAGGNVTIFGKVFDDKDRALAESVARNVPGVTMVNNSVTTDTADWILTQNQIAAQLATAGLTGVNVKVIGKDAYLSGTVASDLDKQRAVTVTQSAAAVTVRGNIITVAPGKVFGF